MSTSHTNHNNMITPFLLYLKLTPRRKPCIAITSSLTMESPLLPLPQPQWSDLPLDLLQLISNRLNSSNTIDLLCLRSVCATWRFYLPKNIPFSEFPTYLPFWSSSSSSGFFVLKESSIYKIEAANEKLNSINWLIKLQEISPGEMRVLDLFSNDRISFLPDNFPGIINLQEFHVKLIRKTYHLEYVNHGCGGLSNFWSLNSEKVAILPSAIMAIHSGGKLGFIKRGEEKWRILDNTWNVIYEDMMEYKGNFIVVDDKGKTVTYDGDFRVTEVAAEGLDGGGGHKKYLMEYSGGEVLLVDKYVKRIWCQSEYSKAAAEFRVYKMNREEKRWEKLRELKDDVALFIGDDCCFYVPVAGDFSGGCIFYRDNRNGGRSRGVCNNGDGVFNVDCGFKAQKLRPIS